MKPRRAPPKYPNKYLVVGFVVCLAGGVLLLWNLGYLPKPGRLWPLAPLLLGMFTLYRVYLKGARDRYILPGMLLTLCGLLFLLHNTVFQTQSLVRVWPAFMLVTGVSIVPFAMKRKGNARIALLVPALFIAALSLLFFVFSLGHAGMSLVEFTGRWWPMILVIIGASLIIAFFIKKRISKS